MIKLKEFQVNAKQDLLKLIDDKDKREIVLQAPTGSGKTIILTEVVREYLTNKHNKTTFVWFTPGAGELEEQSKEKFEALVSEYNSKTLDEAIRNGMHEDEIVFVNWEQVDKDGNRAIRESERKNLLDRIQECKDTGIDFILIVDEAHSHYTKKTQGLIGDFGKCKTIYASATIDKKKLPHIDVEIKEEDVIRSGLITRLISINEGISQVSKIDIDEYKTLLDLAIDKQKAIQQAYVDLYQKGGCKQIHNPLIIIQYPNEHKSNDNYAVANLLDKVDEYLAKNGYTYDNNSVARWLDGDKRNIGPDNKPLDNVIFLHTKQALATGWDCPRAKILIKLRENSSETFEIQVLGRIRRMPEQCHYDNPLLDNCFLYTLDNKYKEAAISVFGGKEAKVLYIKEEYKMLNLGIVKQNKSRKNSENSSDREKVKIACDYIIKRYGLETVNMTSKDKSGYERNKEKLQKVGDCEGYIFRQEIILNITEDQTTASNLDSSRLHTVEKAQIASNDDLYNKCREAEWMIAQKAQLDRTVVHAILQRLFLGERFDKKKKRNHIGRVLGLNKRQYRTFVINNYDQLRRDISASRYSTSTKAAISSFEPIEEVTFAIPHKDVVYLDGQSKTSRAVDNNVYENYTTDIDRSLPEKRFERHCEKCGKVEWIYKNGDKGPDYFSIVYVDNFGKQNLFFPDYILKANNKLYIIETKGGETTDSESKNIDKDKVDLKFDALKKYVEKHNTAHRDDQIAFAFVRDRDVEDDYGSKSYELLFSNTEWTEDLSSRNWKSIDELF